MSKICKFCGAEMEETGSFCPNCGKNNADPVFNNVINVSSPNLEEPVSTSDWILTIILSYIPVIGFILLVFWAFAAKKTSKKNFAKANLIFMIIAFAFIILCTGCFAALAGFSNY